MGTLADFRRKYPQYNDLNDAELANALHAKYYADMPKDTVFRQLKVQIPKPEQPKQEQPLKEVKPAGIFDYFTDREAAIKQDREYRSYIQERQRRENLEDIKTNEGFFDYLGDLISSGSLSLQSGIKNFEAAIETDPELEKRFQEEALRYSRDADTEVAGALTTEDVKSSVYRSLPVRPRTCLVRRWGWQGFRGMCFVGEQMPTTVKTYRPRTYSLRCP